jgi:hypothetical protein
MKFPSTFKELKEIIWNIVGPSIRTITDKFPPIEEDIEVIEEDVEEQLELIEENTEEILATKEEVREVRTLLAKLVAELVSMGIEIDDPDLLDLMEEELNEEIKF